MTTECRVTQWKHISELLFDAVVLFFQSKVDIRNVFQVELAKDENTQRKQTVFDFAVEEPSCSNQMPVGTC